MSCDGIGVGTAVALQLATYDPSVSCTNVNSAPAHWTSTESFGCKVTDPGFGTGVLVGTVLVTVGFVVDVGLSVVVGVLVGLVVGVADGTIVGVLVGLVVGVLVGVFVGVTGAANV
jgi:hypothetical protein